MNVFYFVATLVIVPTVVATVCNDYNVQHSPKDVEGEKCLRTCDERNGQLRCHFSFTIESYYVLSQACFNCPFNITDCYLRDCVTTDGHMRPIVTANRKIPGPKIEVCHGDTIIVDVINQADPQATSIHWHGIRQIGTPYMDGVPMVTQCPIQPFDTFRYEFIVSESGTYFWHGHIAAQKADGLFGGLVVRNSSEQYRYNYDYDLSEHVIVINDWYNSSIIDLFAESAYYKSNFQPYTILVNGRGRYEKFTANGKVYQTPLSVFTVQYGKRYRFRVIGANFECGIQVSIDNHQLEIISTDGKLVEPNLVDGVNILAGERYDFILTANKTIGNYWMKFRGLDTCDARTVSAYQMAILRYDGAPIEDPKPIPSYQFSMSTGVVLNPVIPDSPTMQNSVTTLRSVARNGKVFETTNPDFQYVIEYDFRVFNDSVFNWPLNYHGHNLEYHHSPAVIPVFNYILNTFPPSPLLTQYDSVPKNLICDERSLRKEGRDCIQDLCLCTHVVKVPLHSVVQFLLIDDGSNKKITLPALRYRTNPSVHIDHPIHLHGYSFRVVALGRFSDSNTTAEEIKKLAKENKLVTNLDHAVLKDTVNVPNGGYAVIRFYTDNPGFWLLHCHIDVHLKIGMALTIQVGEVEDHAKPPKGFPKCGNA